MNWMSKAIEIPLDEDCGLYINVGSDGVWMHFTSKCRHASINIDIMAEKDGMIGQVLRSWADDRREKANQIINDTELNAGCGFGR